MNLHKRELGFAVNEEIYKRRTIFECAHCAQLGRPIQIEFFFYVYRKLYAQCLRDYVADNNGSLVET